MLSADIIFRIANTGVLIPWAFLIFSPKSKITHKFVTNGAFSLALSVLYIICFAVAQTQPQDANASFSSLQGVMLLFKSDWGVLTGWVHYLAFDLLVGVLVLKKLEDIQKSSFIFRFPLLFLTLMFGPVGYLCTFVVEKVSKLSNRG